MNKSIRRVRRVGTNIPVTITNNTSLTREIPRTALNVHYQSSIDQRINNLETEVADINIAVASNTTAITNLSSQTVQSTTVPATIQSTTIPVTDIYVRNIQLIYPQNSSVLSGIKYYNVVDPTSINSSSNVTKLPIQIISLDQTSVSSEIVPTPNGLCFMLPYDSCTYQLSFISEVKFNTEAIPVVSPQPTINYLSGSSYSSAMPAVACLTVYQVDSLGVISDTNSSAVISNTWADIITDPTLVGPAPANFKVFQEPTIAGQAGLYYKTGQSRISQSFNLLPLVDSNNQPYGRRLITVAVSNGFSFNYCNLSITKLI